MNEQTEAMKIPDSDHAVTTPDWFLSYAEKLGQKMGEHVTDELLAEYIKQVEGLSLTELNTLIGGNFADLPYEIMLAVLPDGSDDEEVSDIFRAKRESYLVEHPEEKKGGNASEGVIGQDGRFMHIDDWNTLSPGDRFVWLVGPTCFHYNTDVPGYGDDVSLRAKL